MLSVCFNCTLGPYYIRYSQPNLKDDFSSVFFQLCAYSQDDSCDFWHDDNFCIWLVESDLTTFFMNVFKDIRTECMPGSIWQHVQCFEWRRKTTYHSADAHYRSTEKRQVVITFRRPCRHKTLPDEASLVNSKYRLYFSPKHWASEL